MPYTRIWIHLICSTKNRGRLINKELKPVLLEHLITNAKEKNIYLDCINCVEDHIHILLSLKADQSISKVAQLLKGESSFWINKNKLLPLKFEWQEEYIAISVSESVVPAVREYIKKQEEHHKRKSFQEEFNEIMEKYRFEKSKE